MNSYMTENDVVGSISNRSHIVILWTCLVQLDLLDSALNHSFLCI